MPSLSPLLIDKLAITLPLSDMAFDRATEQLNALSLAGYEIEQAFSPYYRATYSIALSPYCQILISLGAAIYSTPRPSDDPEVELDLDIESTGTRRRCRIEWNPAKAAKHREAFLFAIETLLGEEFRSEFQDARITRIDIAVDIIDVNINRLAISRSDTSVKSAIYYDRDGKPQTVYLGDKSSPLRFAIYDKKTQARPVRRYRQERTRIEAWIKTRLTIQGLLNYPNPFSRLAITEFEELEWLANHANYKWEWFIDSSKSRGREAALNLMPTRSRNNWGRKLSEIRGPRWWDPEVVWAGLRSALEEIGLWQFH